MTDTYTLWIVSLPGFIWSHVFDEVALGLQSAFKELGYDVPIVTDRADVQGTAIVLGPNLLPKLTGPLPEKMILFNLEQVHEASIWFAPRYGYVKLLRQYPVWDFSHYNIAALKQHFGIGHAVHCGIGYSAALTRVPHGKEDIDALLIGGNHPRRTYILDKMAEKNIKARQVERIFGERRDKWLARGKIHLNVHKEPGHIFEIVRVSYLLANKRFVLSEPGKDKELESAFQDAVVFCPYEEMPERCLHYLEHPQERKHVAEQGFELFRQMPQSGFLAGALEMHRQREVAPQKMTLPRLFVNIASYRDPECQWTVKDLFEKAAHPERIHVGICWQYDPGEDAECFAIDYPRPEQVRVIQYHIRDSQGAGWARGEAQSLWQGEEYTLQIQAHMRFEPGWDDMLIEMLSRCSSEKSVIGAYAPPYTPPDALMQYPNALLRIRVRRLGDVNDPQIIHLTAAVVPLSDTQRNGLYPSPFWIGNVLFAPSRLLAEVPNDPHIYFFGEELAYSARLYTHGWDIFQPDRVVLYHQWDRRETFGKQNYRRMADERNQRSMMRVKHLLGFEQADNSKALVEMDRYGLGTARPLEDLWTFAGVDWRQRTITKDGLEGKWNSSPHRGEVGRGASTVHGQVLSKSAPTPTLPLRGRETLFVNIASYRDPECQWTVKDLFEKAAHPDRIHVGICWQFDAEEDKDCFQLSTRPGQVSMLPVDWREGEGVCWARHQTQQLWDGEDYNLQIDAHMRFVPGWDELMIKELEACEADQPVLSCNSAAYTPPDKLQRELRPTVRRVRPFQPDGNIRGQGEYIDRAPDKPLNGAFVAAGFLFSRGNIVAEVPYDPYLYFDQEEITYAARLYTHGWDVFSSRRPFMYHYYNDNTAAGSVRPLHWKDLREEDEKKIRYLQGRGLKRFNHLTGYQLSEDAEITKELAAYGFGRARSLQQFEEYTGIDFKRKIASEKALRCLFIKDLHKYSRGIRIPEIDNIPSPRRGRVGVGADLQGEKNLAQGKNAPLPTSPLRGEGYRELILEEGDFIPLFTLTDTSRSARAVEIYGGQHCMLFFLPAGDVAYVSDFFKHLQQRFARAKHKNVWQLFILGDTVDNLIALKEKIGTQHALWADPDRKLARAFGLCRSGDKAVPPAGYVLNNNLKIVRRSMNLGAAQLAASIVDDCQAEVANYRLKNHERRIVSQLPPALIIPHAFTPELCKKCIDAFHVGHKFEGTVGAEEKTGYRPNAKIRTDHIITGALLDEIDEKFSRSVFPEIRKIFGFEVTHRELYKVGLYKGDKGGFFKAHRDNFDMPLGYRRIAMTLHLNDDYEGGGLRFPEYDEHIYRPAAGSAIAFSCATIHEARPVISGERYILVCFFHGEEEEAFRRYYLAGKGSPLKIKDYTPKLRPQAEIAQSRDYYRDWRRKHVKFDVEKI